MQATRERPKSKKKTTQAKPVPPEAIAPAEGAASAAVVPQQRTAEEALLDELDAGATADDYYVDGEDEEEPQEQVEAAQEQQGQALPPQERVAAEAAPRVEHEPLVYPSVPSDLQQTLLASPTVATLPVAAEPLMYPQVPQTVGLMQELAGLHQRSSMTEYTSTLASPPPVAMAPEYVADLDNSTAPLLTDTDEAPPELQATVDEADEYIQHLVGPLDDTLLDQLFDREALRNTGELVNAHNSKSLEDSPFHALVRKYNESCNQLEAIKVTIKSLEIKELAATDSTWRISQKILAKEQECGCGNVVKYTIKYEEAAFDRAQINVVGETQAQTREQFYNNFVMQNFEMKLATLSVENYLNTYISKMEGLSYTYTERPSATPEQIDMLLHFLHVLFHYERQAKARGDGALAASQENPADAANKDSFLQKVRSWIVYVVSALMKLDNTVAHTRLLLFMLDTPGISDWGANFVHFSHYDTWNEGIIDHFLVMIKLLFSKQLQMGTAGALSQLGGSSVSIVSALSDGEWLVLDDKAAPGALARAVSLPTHNLISEQDYLLILEQYPFTEFCNYLVRNMIVLAEDDITMFQLFAVAKRFIVVLSQAFVAFPVQGYSNLRRRMAQIICQFIATIAVSWDPSTTSERTPHFNAAELKRKWTYRPGTESTLQAEIDAVVLRATMIILLSPAGGIWSLLSSIPYRIVSADGAWRILHAILHPQTTNGETVPLRSWQIMLSDAYNPGSTMQVLLRSHATAMQDSAFLLTALGELGTSRAARAFAYPANPNSRLDVLEEHLGRAFLGAVTSEIFTVSFLNLDTRDTLKRFGRDALAAKCTAYPYLISFLLKLVDHFSAGLGGMAGFVMLELPLELWMIHEEDFDILRRWLLDLDVSKPTKHLAQAILERLPWGYHSYEENKPALPTSKGYLTIPAHYHRRTALMLVDYIATTNAWLKNSANNNAAGKKRLADVEEFCRKLLNQLCLDCGQHLDKFSFVPYASTLDPLDYRTDISLAAARDLAPVSAVAAYVVLFTSTCGYTEGLADERNMCLQVLLDKGYAEGVYTFMSARSPALAFNVSNWVASTSLQKIVRSLYLGDGIGATAGSGAAVVGFLWKAIVGESQQTDNPHIGLIVEQLYYASLHDRQQLEEEDVVVSSLLRLWTGLVFIVGGDDWFRSTPCLTVMNTLTKAAIILHRENVLKDILLDQYALFIVRIKEQKERSNASALSFLRNMVTLPSSMLDGNPPPQLEVNNSNASEQAVVFASRIVSTTANLLTGTQGVEHIHLWFAFLQLWTETVFERDLRDKIGRYLVLHPQARLADIYNNPNNPDISLEKPLGQYMIYRWADHCIAMPPEHPLTPLYWQVCLSLIFAQVTSRGLGNFNPYYGMRFLAMRPSLRDELKGRLVLNASAQLQLADKARKNPQLVGKSNIEEPLYPPAVHMNLHLFFSAAALWLSDARIQTKDFVVDALTDKQYDPPRLNRLLSDNSFEDGYAALWTDLLDVNAIASWLRPRENVHLVKLLKRQLALRVATSRPAKFVHPPSKALSASTFVPRLPEVLPLNLDRIANARNGVLFREHVVLGQADMHIQRKQLHQSLDHQKLQYLTQLYVPESKERHVTMVCDQQKSRSVCRGAARFHFQYQERRKVVEVAKTLEKIKLDTRNLIVKTNVPDDLVRAACEISTTINWIIEAVDSSKTTAERKEFYSTCAAAAFFNLLDNYSSDAGAYPPASILLLSSIEKLGNRFIRNSPEQVPRIFGKMTENIAMIDRIATYFQPVLLPHQFVSLYQELLEKTAKLGLPYTSLLINRFDVAAWLKTSPSFEERETFLRLLLGTIDIRIGLIDANDPKFVLQSAIVASLRPILQVAVDAHMDDFVPRLAAIMIDQHVSPRVVEEVFETIVDRSLSAKVLTSIVSNMSASSNDNASHVLRVSPEIAVKFLTLFGSALSKSRDTRGGVLAPLHIYQDGLYPLIGGVALATSSLFKPDATLEDFETSPVSPWSPLRTIYAAFLATLPRSMPWESDTEHHAAKALSLFTALVRQMATRNDLVKELAFHFIMTSFNIDMTEPVARLVRTQCLGINWNRLVVDRAALAAIEQWLARSPVPARTHALGFALNVYVVGTLTPRYVQSLDAVVDYWGTALHILLTILESWKKICVMPSDRKVLLGVTGRLIQEVNWSYLPAGLVARIFAVRVQGNRQLLQVAAAAAPPATATIDSDEVQLFSALHHLAITVTESAVDRQTLAQLIGTNVEIRQRVLEKIKAWVQFIASTITLVVNNKVVVPRPAASMLTDTYNHLELVSSVLQAPERDAVIAPMVSELLGVFNHLIPTNTVVNDAVWGAQLQAVWNNVQLPLVFMCSAGRLASVARMAMLTELAFDRVFQLTRGGNVWDVAYTHFIVPELEDSQAEFMRECLDEGRVYNLYAYALQKLRDASADIKPVIIVELSQWIDRLKPKDSQVAHKTVLLIVKFCDLYYEDLMLHADNTDLRQLMAPFIRSLVRFGEDRSSSGLLGNIGWGAASTYSAEFRWFCKTLAAFLGSRFMDPRYGYAHPEKLMEAIMAARRTREYGKVPNMDVTLTFLNRRGSTLAELPTFVRDLAASLFASDVAIAASLVARS